MLKFDKLCEFARERRDAGVPLEQVLQDLRGLGASIIDSLKIVRQVEAVSLGTAKDLIDNSPTWADYRECNERVRNEAENSLGQSLDLLRVDAPPDLEITLKFGSSSR